MGDNSAEVSKKEMIEWTSYEFRNVASAWLQNGNEKAVYDFCLLVKKQKRV